MKVIFSSILWQDSDGHHMLDASSLCLFLGPSSYKFQCKICNSSFPTKAKLQFHWKKHDSTQFSCKECPKQFSFLSLLHAHEATHVAHNKRPFPCTKCEKTFTTKHKLQTHIEVCSNYLYPFLYDLY